MAVAEGRAARAGLAKLAAANRADELLALLAIEQPVLPELDFTRALRRAGASLDDDERRAVLRKFPARDESGLRGVQVSLLLEHLQSARLPTRTPPRTARRASSTPGSGSSSGGKRLDPREPVSRQLTLKPAVVRQQPRAPRDPEPLLPPLQRLPPPAPPHPEPEPVPEPQLEPEHEPEPQQPPPQPLLQWEPEPEPEPEWKGPAQLASVVAEPAHVTILEPSAAAVPTEGATLPEPSSSDRSGEVWKPLAAALAAALAVVAFQLAGRGSAAGGDPRLLSACGEDLRCWLSVAGADRLDTASGLSALGISTVSNLLGARLSTADLEQLGVPSVAYLEAQYAHVLRDQPLPPQPPLPPPPPPASPQEGSSWSLWLGVAVLWYVFVRWMQPSDAKELPGDSGGSVAQARHASPSTPGGTAAAAAIPTATTPSAAAATPTPSAAAATPPSRGSRPRRSLNTPNTPTRVHTWAVSSVGSAGSGSWLGGAGQQRHAPRTPDSAPHGAQPQQRRSVASPPAPVHAASPTKLLTMVDGGMTAAEHRKLVANVAAARQESHDAPEQPVVIAADGAAALDGAMASLRE